jgi:hypothetical protein
MEQLIPEDVLIKINELKIEREEVYNERTDINRDVKSLESRISASKYSQEEIDLYTKEKSIAEANQELEKAKIINENIDKSNDFLSSYDSNFEAIQKQIDELEARKTEMAEKKQKVNTFLKANPTKYDTEKLLDNLQNLSDFNTRVKEVAELKQVEIQLKEKQSESDAKTERLEKIDEQKDKLFKEANLPVEGLDFNETGITYNGLPLHETQLPTSEIMTIGMKIGMALNPSLRLIVIKDGSLLDEETLKHVIDSASKEGYQVLIEVVSNNSELDLEFIERD